MATLADVLGVAQYSRNDFNYLKRKNLLRTKFAETTQGTPADLSRDNALEIAFIAALSRGGATPKRAALFADRLRIAVLNGERRAWYVFPDGNFTKTKWSDAPDLERLSVELGSHILTSVCVEEIVRRVDKLFSEPGEAAS